MDDSSDPANWTPAERELAGCDDGRLYRCLCGALVSPDDGVHRCAPMPGTAESEAASAPNDPADCEECLEDFSFRCDRCGQDFCGAHASAHTVEDCDFDVALGLLATKDPR